MAFRDYCDGVHRRDFLRVGALGFLGLNLSSYLRYADAAAKDGKSVEKSGILVYLGGGPTHMDTWDLKPEAPEGIRGELKPIKTNVPGIEISELLPQMAQHADKFAILRSVTHNLAAHEPGQLFLRTGNRPLPSLQFPGYGSVVNKEVAAPPGVPPYIALPVGGNPGATPQTAGYLGVAYNPFTVNEDPSKESFSVRALTLPQGLSMERINARRGLLNGLDTAFRTVEVKSQDLSGMDRFYQQAFDILNSPKAREAFDIGQEKAEVRDRYGRTPFGQTCLLARRLIQAGVRFVAIDFGGWDMHAKIYPNLKTKLPQLDQGLSALLEELHGTGLLPRTALMMTGEFGRTPKVNANAGRDHWSRAMSIVMAGGGIQGGQVLGKTNDKGEEPVEDPIKPEDVAASFYQALDIDPHKEYQTPTGRPVHIVRDGKPIKKLFA